MAYRVDNLPHLCLVDAAGAVVLPAASAPGRSILDAIDPTDRRAVEGWLRSGVAMRDDCRLLRPDGGSRRVHLRMVPLYVDGERLRGVMLDDVAEPPPGAEQLYALHQATVELARTRTLNELCRRAVELGRELLGYDRLSFWLLRDDPTLLWGTWGVAADGTLIDERQETFRVKPGGGVELAVLGEGRPLLLEDSSLYGVGGAIVGRGTRAVLPLRCADGVLGCLLADNLLTGRPLTPHDREVLALYASSVGQLCSVKSAEEERDALTRLSTRLASVRTVNDIVEVVAEETAAQLEWDAHYVAILRPGEPALRVPAFHDTVEGRKCCFPPYTWPAHDLSSRLQGLLEGESILLNPDPEEGDHERGLARFGDRSRRSASLMYAPIRSGDDVLGFVSVQSYTPHRYGARELQRLQRLADRCAAELERAFTQEALARSDALSRAVIEAIPDLLLRVSRQGVVLEALGSGSESLPTPADRLRGTRLADLLPSPLADDVLRLLRAAFATGVTQVFEHQGPEPAAMRYFEARVTAYRPDEALILVRDVTDRRLLEQQLQQSAKMEAVGRLAGGVAHDFNNLLTTIAGYADLLLLRVDASAELAPPLHEISRAAERAAALTQQLLAFSRQQVIQPRRLDLNASLREMTGMMRRLIGEDVHLEIELADEPLVVVADPVQVQQVVLNLVINARDAMPDGGALELKAAHRRLTEPLPAHGAQAQPGDYVVLSVEDDGAGMPAEVVPRIFEPFFTTKELGTGLGLATVYGVVQQWGGVVCVRSAPGEGTRFDVYLPRALGAGEPAPPPRPAAEPGRERVLLVEDQDDVRRVTEQMLSRFGYDVVAADGPEAALGLSADAEPFDLLVTDVVMPGMNGVQLAERLTSRQPRLKVLFISGYTDDVLGSVALDDEFAFLAKPFRAPDLARTVRAVLDAD